MKKKGKRERDPAFSRALPFHSPKTSLAKVVPRERKREGEGEIFAGGGARLADNSYAAMIYR